MIRESQKKASQSYRDKLISKGYRQHLVWATDSQWAIIYPVSQAIKSLQTDSICQVDFDDNREYIRFIRQKTPETRVVLANPTQDDKL